MCMVLLQFAKFYGPSSVNHKAQEVDQDPRSKNETFTEVTFMPFCISSHLC